MTNTNNDAALIDDEVPLTDADIGKLFDVETDDSPTLDAAGKERLIGAFLRGHNGIDSLALDGVDADGYCGKIMKDGVVIGRIDIGDDGKAMVFVGDSGDVRVNGREGRPFDYSDSDAPDMVDALFTLSTTSKPEELGMFDRKFPMSVKEATEALIIEKYYRSSYKEYWWRIASGPDASTKTFRTGLEALEYYYTVVVPRDKETARKEAEQEKLENYQDVLSGKAWAAYRNKEEAAYLDVFSNEVIKSSSRAFRQSVFDLEDKFSPRALVFFKSIDDLYELSLMMRKSKDAAAPAPPDTPPDVPELIAAGFRRVLNNDYVRAVQAGDKKLQFNVRVTEDGFIVRMTVGFSGGITGVATEIGRTADVGAAIALADAEAAKRGDGQADPQKAADDAFENKSEEVQPPAKSNSRSDFVSAMTYLTPFLSRSQLKAVNIGAAGEEAQYFYDKMVEIAEVVRTMPKTYEQDGKGGDAVAYLHYFKGGGDWYITEKDEGGGDVENMQQQAFGLADIYGDGGELGYISIQELVNNGVELDLHWQPKTINQIRGKVAEPQQATEKNGGITLGSLDEAFADAGWMVKATGFAETTRDGERFMYHANLSANTGFAMLDIWDDGAWVPPPSAAKVKSFTLTPTTSAKAVVSHMESSILDVLAALKDGRGGAPDDKDQSADDRALFQSVIDGTVSDILSPALADDLEAAYNRHAEDSDMAALFEQAVNAYQTAMLAATANLS